MAEKEFRLRNEKANLSAAFHRLPRYVSCERPVSTIENLTVFGDFAGGVLPCDSGEPLTTLAVRGESLDSPGKEC